MCNFMMSIVLLILTSKHVFANWQLVHFVSQFDQLSNVSVALV